MKQLLNRFIGESILVGGIGFFMYGVFHFSFQVYGGKDGFLPDFGPESTNMGAVYYYSDNALIMIAAGAMLVAVGVLMIKSKVTKGVPSL